MAEIKSESVADFIPESTAGFARNTQLIEESELLRVFLRGTGDGVPRNTAELTLTDQRPATAAPVPDRRSWWRWRRRLES